MNCVVITYQVKYVCPRFLIVDVDWHIAFCDWPMRRGKRLSPSWEILQFADDRLRGRLWDQVALIAPAT